MKTNYNEVLPQLKELSSYDYIESLYERIENDLYRFTGDTEDIRLTLMEHWIGKEDILSKEVRKVNNDWYRLDVSRKYNGTEVEDVCANTIRDGDKVYIDSNGEFVNFSNDSIYFFRVDNMEECDEVIDIPKAFEQGSMIEYGRSIREKDEILLHFAWMYHSEFMNHDELIERFMKNEYGNDYAEYSVDDYYKDRTEDEMEMIACCLERTGLTYDEWKESDEGREYYETEKLYSDY